MRKYKLSLDIFMIVIIATLYNKNVISLAYHEIVGLALILLFILHLVFNRKWISVVKSNIKNLNPRVKALAIVDILLCVSWLAVMVTGILISKKIFQFELEDNGIYIRLHFFTGAVALILTGLHLAMHRSFFAGLFKKKIALAVLIIFTLAGFWGVTRIDMGKWLAAPFVTAPEHEHQHEEQENQGGQGKRMGRGLRKGKPFSPVKLLEVIFGTVSVILVVNAVDYVLEKAIKKG